MDKSFFNSFIVLLLAAAALTSCEQCANVTISNPTAADSEWLVYKANDTISFETEAGDTIRYARTGIYAENVPGEGFSTDDECIDELNVRVRTVVEDVDEEQPALGTRILSKPDSLVVQLAVDGMGIWEIDQNNPGYDSLAVNGMMYYDVFELTPAVTTTNSVEQILFNKEFGFLHIQFDDMTKLVRIPEQ